MLEQKAREIKGSGSNKGKNFSVTLTVKLLRHCIQWYISQLLQTMKNDKIL